MIDLSKYRLIDLTHDLDEKMAGFSSEISRTVEKDGWNARDLTIYSHAGTHMDAPFHFGVNKQTIDQYPLERLLGPSHLVRIDIREPRQLIQPQDLGELRELFPAGENLLIQTGWSQMVYQSTYRDELPRISRELARWCVEKQVNLLGVEPVSVADVNNLEEVTEIHRILLGGNVIIVEGLKQLHQIQRDKVFLIAMPLRIKGGDGAPARIIALENR